MADGDERPNKQHAEAADESVVMQAGRDIHNHLGNEYARPPRWWFGVLVVVFVVAGLAAAVVLTALAAHGNHASDSPTAAGKRTLGSPTVGGSASGSVTSAPAKQPPGSFSIVSGPLTIAGRKGNAYGAQCSTGLGWVYPEAANELPPYPISVSADASRIGQSLAYAQAQHGVPSLGTGLTLTLQGSPGHTVVLTGMEVHIAKRRPPVAGTYYADSGCGGVTPRWFLADLDSRVIHPESGMITTTGGSAQSGPAAAPPVSFPYKVSEDDPEVFVIMPSSKAYDSDWELDLSWSSDGQNGEAVINDGGKPFRFTADSAAESCLPGNGGTWACFGKAP